MEINKIELLYRGISFSLFYATVGTTISLDPCYKHMLLHMKSPSMVMPLEVTETLSKQQFKNHIKYQLQQHLLQQTSRG
jgi:hypothetical protein